MVSGGQRGQSRDADAAERARRGEEESRRRRRARRNAHGFTESPVHRKVRGVRQRARAPSPPQPTRHARAEERARHRRVDSSRGRRRSGHGDGYQRIGSGAVRPGFLRAQGLPADNPARGGEVALAQARQVSRHTDAARPGFVREARGSEAAARVGSDRKRDIDDGQIVQVLRRWRGVQAGEHRPRDDVERSLAVQTGREGGQQVERRARRGGGVGVWEVGFEIYSETGRRLGQGIRLERAGFAHAHVERFERVRRRRRFRHAVGVGGGIVPRGEQVRPARVLLRPRRGTGRDGRVGATGRRRRRRRESRRRVEGAEVTRAHAAVFRRRRREGDVRGAIRRRRRWGRRRGRLRAREVTGDQARAAGGRQTRRFGAETRGE